MITPLKVLVLMGCTLCVGCVGVLAAEAAKESQPAAEQSLRDPFSPLPAPAKPVAVVPPPVLPSSTGTPEVRPAVPNEDPAATLRSALQVQGFLQQGTRRYAMVNGRLVTAGDVLQVRQGGVMARFRVREVSTTKVEFDRLP